VLFGIVSVSAVVGLNILFELGGVTNKAEAYEILKADPYSANIVVGILCTCFVAPIAEEIVFRGAIYNALKKLYKPQYAILMSALLFGLINQDSVQGVYSFVMGCFAAYTYEYFGNFLMPVIVRVVASVVAYLITYTSIVNTPLYSTPMCALFGGITLVAIFMISKEKKIL
jgi:membrane protease YdiL (CAAX protease family)